MKSFSQNPLEKKSTDTAFMQQKLAANKAVPQELCLEEFVRASEVFSNARSQQAQDLEKDAQDLHAMVKDLATVIDVQQGDIDKIEVTLDNTAIKAEQAERMIAEAEQNTYCVIL